MYVSGVPSGRPGPKKAVALLGNVVDIESPPKPLKAWLSDLILNEKWESHRTNADEVAERWEASALSLIRSALSKADPFGRPALFTTNSSSEYLIQGAAYIEGSESAHALKHKARRKHVFRVLDAMRTLSHREFEGFCANILKELGAKTPTTTKFSGDEGIDFFGKLELRKHIFPDDLAPTLQAQLNVWMVGQAKHYQAIKVATPDIRELVGSVELARHRAFGSAPGIAYPELNILACDPIFRLFFTTGEISQAGWQLLEQSGVIGMDGLMLAAFLCDRGVCQTGAGFSVRKFKTWAMG